MKAPVEERLRRALAQHAAATAAPPDAWQRIEAATRRRRRPQLMRPVLLAPALAVAMIVLVATLNRDDEAKRVRVAGEAGRVYLAPSGLEGYRLTEAITDPQSPPAPAGTQRVFARRGADGVTMPASIVVNIPPDQQPQVTGPGTKTLHIAGEDLATYRDPDGRLVLSWQEAGGPAVGLSAFGVSDEEIVAVAESLRPGPAATSTPRLPDGFAIVQDGPLPTAPFRLTDQAWESKADKFRLTVTEVPSVSLDAVAWGHPHGRAVAVRGTTGLFDDATSRDPSMLTWIERHDTVVTMLGFDMDLARLREIADGLRPIDETGWHKLATTALTSEPPRGGPGAMLVATGERDGAQWEAAIQDAGGKDGVCLNLDYRDFSRQLCVPASPPAPPAVVGVTVDNGFLLATAGEGVASLRVVMADGSVVTASPVRRRGDSTRFVVVSLPSAAEPTSVVALDDAGREVSTTAVSAP